MTRKTCNNNNTHVGLAFECDGVYGYDHGRLRSRRTVAHQRFTRRNSRFLHIDDLYRSDSTITKLFLKINDIALNQTLNSLRRSSLPTETSKPTIMTRNKLLRRQTSMYDKLKSPESPNSDSCFHLRRRRHTSYINNFDSSTDEDSNHTKPMRELRSASKLLVPAVKTPEPSVWDSGRPKRQIKPKRFSVEERLVVNNKNHFKEKVTKHRLKTTNNDKPRVLLLKNYSSDTEDDDKAKNKKIRETELTRLNNEAENFLFPRSKDESSVDSEDTLNEEYRRSSPVSQNDLVNGNSSSKCNKGFKWAHEEESRDSTSSDASYRRRKRRLTQAEAFILDNQQYYKFETPGSRLRYHGSYLTPLLDPSTPPTTTSTTTSNTVSTSSCFFSKNNGDIISKQLKAEESTKKVKKKYNLDRLQFSFEVIPRCEAWYETFHRQDIGEERYTNCSTSLLEEKKISLPYELSSIPPLNPRLCLYAYQELRRSFLGESPSSRSVTCNTPDSCSLDTTSKTDDTSTGDDTRSSADFHANIDSPFVLRRGRRGRTRFIGTSKTPRKSPRQHASTLAILSTLISPRRSKQKLLLSPIKEEKGSKPNYTEITTFFAACLDDLDPVEVEPEAIDCNVHCKPSAVTTLEEYLNVPMKSKPISKGLDRKIVRKKRTNKTGWPNKSKKLAFKKEGSHSSGSIIDSTDSSSKSNDMEDTKLNNVKTEIEKKSNIDDNSGGDRINCVNVDLAKWENAERLLTAKLRSDFQPVVRVQKLANNIIQRRNQIVPCLRPRRSSLPVSSKSPRTLRRPRDKLK